MADSIADTIESFFSKYPIRKFTKGQVILLVGDPVEHVCNLISGKVKMYDVTYRGDEIILNVYKPPAFFPMAQAINPAPSPYIFEAETDIELRQAPVEDVIAFVRENNAVLFDLMSRVYRGIDGMTGRMANLMAGSAKERLMYELVIEARRFGIQKANGSCVLEINEKEIGARAGLSRETVNREINKLKAEGIIEVRPKELVIVNLAVFQERTAPQN